MKGLRRNKKWDVVTFGMESTTVRSRLNVGGRGVRSGTILTGMALLCKPKLALAVRCCAGWSARGLQGREN